MRLMTAFKAFFAVLFDRDKAERIAPVLSGESQLLLETEKQPEKIAPPKPEKLAAAKPGQSEAITLLAALQREARFLDFLMEKLDGYDDAQVGAAARSVHDECAAVVERFFEVRPLRTEDEMSQITVETPDAAREQLVGDVRGEPPYTGRLTHHGWIANRCELPKWSGKPESALVVAPAEIELG